MVIHWDEVEGRTVEVGEMRGTWRRLARAAPGLRATFRVEQVDLWDGEA